METEVKKIDITPVLYIIVMARSPILVTGGADSLKEAPLVSWMMDIASSIQAVIEGRATRDQESYSIAGRSLSRTPLEELHKFEAIYKSRVFQEEQNERMKRGQGTGGQVKVGF